MKRRSFIQFLAAIGLSPGSLLASNPTDTWEQVLHGGQIIYEGSVNGIRVSDSATELPSGIRFRINDKRQLEVSLSKWRLTEEMLTFNFSTVDRSNWDQAVNVNRFVCYCIQECYIRITRS